jgi:hypothetical protein
MEYHITLPLKPRVVSEEGMQGIYEIDSLYPGYGHTLGNSLAPHYPFLASGRGGHRP